MKVSELENGLWFGDVVIQCIDTNIISGEPMKKKGYMELVITWIRNENRDGPRDVSNPDDFDVQLMEMDGEICTIQDVRTMDDWEYSHCAFQRGVWRE